MGYPDTASVSPCGLFAMRVAERGTRVGWVSAHSGLPATVIAGQPSPIGC
jgi:hypothetical protein